MKIKEFVDYMKKNTNRTMKEDQVATVIKRALEPKSYISIKDKKQLVENIVEKCIYYDNGVFKFDGIDRYVYFTMLTLEAYTNLELEEDIENDFDALSESKLLPAVICLIQQEFDDVNLFLQMHCEYILEGNSLEAQFGKFFNELLDKIDTFSDGLSKSLSKIDVAKLMKDKDKILKFLEDVNK
mgnify:CR=1 FL=1